MYEKHQSFKEPDENAKVWRYMTFAEFVSLIDRNALHFVRVDKLDDPYEGKYSEANKKHAVQVFENIMDIGPGVRADTMIQVNSFIQKVRKSICLSSWHVNDYDSEAMWMRYSEISKGIAIQTTFKCLTQSFHVDQKETERIGLIQYVDYNSFPISRENEFQPFLHKRKAFECERELRVLLSRWDTHNERPAAKTPCSGIYVPVDLNQLIDTIYVSPLAKEWFHELVKSVSKKFGIDKTVKYSPLRLSPPK